MTLFLIPDIFIHFFCVNLGVSLHYDHVDQKGYDIGRNHYPAKDEPSVDVSFSCKDSHEVEHCDFDRDEQDVK